MKENICKLHIQIIDQYLEYIENFKKLNGKVKNPLETGHFMSKSYLTKEDGKQANGKIFNIISNQENSN